MLPGKKSASSSPVSWSSANALLFVGLILTIAASSFKIVFAHAQTTASLCDFFTTTSISDIPLSIGDLIIEDQIEEEEEEEELPLRVAFVRHSFTYAAYQQNGFYNFYEKI